MTDTKPKMEPNGTMSTSNPAGGEASMPSALPPEGVAVTSSADSDSSALAGAGDAAPSIKAPDGVTAGITAWQNNKRINGLWSINQNRNSHVSISGIGWKKLVNNSDSAIVALTMLSAHAREKDSPVNYREEGDGMIYEMYVW
jgi:hypothetical protein